MAETLKQLRELPLEKLVELHDARAEHSYFGPLEYKAELDRRDQETQTRAMLKMTRTMERCTLIITWLTVVNTAAAILGAVVSLMK